MVWYNLILRADQIRRVKTFYRVRHAPDRWANFLSFMQYLQLRHDCDSTAVRLCATSIREYNSVHRMGSSQTEIARRRIAVAYVPFATTAFYTHVCTSSELANLATELIIGVCLPRSALGLPVDHLELSWVAEFLVLISLYSVKNYRCQWSWQIVESSARIFYPFTA